MAYKEVNMWVPSRQVQQEMSLQHDAELYNGT